MDPVTTDTSSLWRYIGEATLVLLCAAPARELRQSPGATMALTGEPVADLNFIVLEASPDPVARLREFGEVIRVRQLPVLVMVSAAVADAVAPAARDLGLTHAGTMPLMTHDGQGVTRVPGAFTVTRAESAADLVAAGRILACANALPEDAVQRACGPALLDAPGVDVFLAWRGNTPISSVTTTQHGATVGIWSMATLPELQRAGAGRALLTDVMAQHRASGVRLFFLGATEAGYHLYESMGFRTVETPAVWVAGHSTQVHS
jgi:ribosomal protein S18 acetylase RimI-like enzyme